MPTPDDLREMERLLNQRDSKRCGALWWWAGAMGIALLAGAVIWWNVAGASMQDLQQPVAKSAERSSLWNQLAIRETTETEPTSGQTPAPANSKDAITQADVQSAHTPRVQTAPQKKQTTASADSGPSMPSVNSEKSTVTNEIENPKEMAMEKEIRKETGKPTDSGITSPATPTLRDPLLDHAIASQPDSIPNAGIPLDTARIAANDSTFSESITTILPDSIPARKKWFEIQGGVSLVWPSLRDELSYARGGLETSDQLFLFSQDASLRLRANRWQFGTGLSVMRYNPGFIYEPIAASDLTITGEGQNIQINFVDFPEIIEAAEQLEAISMFNAWTIPVFAGYTIPIRENRMEVMPRAGLAVSFQSRETLTYTQRWVPYYDIPQIQVYQQREYLPITRTNRKQSTNALLAAEFRFILPRSLILVGEPGVWLDPGSSTPGAWNRAPYFRFSIGYAF